MKTVFFVCGNVWRLLWVTKYLFTIKKRRDAHSCGVAPVLVTALSLLFGGDGEWLQVLQPFGQGLAYCKSTRVALRKEYLPGRARPGLRVALWCRTSSRRKTSCGLRGRCRSIPSPASWTSVRGFLRLGVFVGPSSIFHGLQR